MTFYRHLQSIPRWSFHTLEHCIEMSQTGCLSWVYHSKCLLCFSFVHVCVRGNANGAESLMHQREWALKPMPKESFHLQGARALPVVNKFVFSAQYHSQWTSLLWIYTNRQHFHPGDFISADLKKDQVRPSYVWIFFVSWLTLRRLGCVDFVDGWSCLWKKNINLTLCHTNQK